QLCFCFRTFVHLCPLTLASPIVIYSLSLHDALPISSTFSPESFVNDLVSDLLPSDSLLFSSVLLFPQAAKSITKTSIKTLKKIEIGRDTSELQSRFDLVCRLLLEKKNNSMMRF